MRQLTTAEIKNRILKLLDLFLAVCNDNGFRYYLGYGSALGAERFGGFIPWDDDLDILMPREDYECFLKLCSKDSFNLFSCLYFGKTEGYHYYFAKIVDTDTVMVSEFMRDIPEMGAFIDIFPMDEVTLTRPQVLFFGLKLKYCTRMLGLSGMKKFWPSENPAKNFFKQVLYSYASRKDAEYWQNVLRSVIEKAKLENNTKNKKYLVGESILDEKWFGTGKLVLFEGRWIICPKEIKSYLKKMYGDYTVLPPIEKRVTVHDFTVYEK